ncbi:MAG: hypothetical protein H6741_24500 [Alphaproteobacteria bacterium]|nr:hypothetical protein [Alphaproteobacteria bacterium]
MSIPGAAKGAVALALTLMVACAPVEPEDVRGTAPATPTDDWQRDTGPFELPTGCALGPADAGEWAGRVPVEQITTEPYAFDAGVAAVIEASPAQGQRVDVQLRVEGAVITNVGYPEAENVWFADGGGAMRTYSAPWGVSLEPGDVVSFEVREISNYRGELEVIDLGNVEVIGSGEPVFFVDATEQSVSVAEHARQNIRAWAEVVSGPTDCSSNCFDVDLGSQTELLRISSSRNFDPGDCLELFAPMGVFDGEIQFNIENYDWYREF